MSQDQSHKMSPQELSDWIGADPVEAAGPKERKAREPSQSAKNERVLAAAGSGDAKSLAEALSCGGNPNAREKTRPRRSAIDIALDGAHDQTASILLEAGGLQAPYDYAGKTGNQASLAFNEMALSGVFKDSAIERTVKRDTLEAFVNKAQSWELIKRARDRFDPEEKLEEMVAVSAITQRWPVVLQAYQSGVSAAKAWSAFSARQKYKGWDTRALVDRKTLEQAFSEPGLVDQLSAKGCEWLFRSAAYWGDATLLRAMLNGGLKPSADWTVELDGEWDYAYKRSRSKKGGERVSILSFAAASESVDAFNLLKTCAPALAAASKRVDSPWSLREIPISRLIELSALGCAIDGYDEDDGNLLHVWAQCDQSPRAGWATIARELPVMFAQQDSSGRAGAEKMREKLRNQSDKDAFSASLSRIESREIRREVPREKAKATTPSRSRL